MWQVNAALADPVELARQVGERLKTRRYLLAVAESCTGGAVAQACTAIAGSSAWFERGFVTYSNTAKREMLGVKTDVLARYGAVSEQTARTMATGALARSPAQIALAVTGIAGPSGGTTEKPVGTVWCAWAGKNSRVVTKRFHFAGDRAAVRGQAVAAVLAGLIEFLA